MYITSVNTNNISVHISHYTKILKNRQYCILIVGWWNDVQFLGKSDWYRIMRTVYPPRSCVKNIRQRHLFQFYQEVKTLLCPHLPSYLRLGSKSFRGTLHDFRNERLFHFQSAFFCHIHNEVYAIHSKSRHFLIV